MSDEEGGPLCSVPTAPYRQSSVETHACRFAERLADGSKEPFQRDFESSVVAYDLYGRLRIFVIDIASAKNLGVEDLLDAAAATDVRRDEAFRVAVVAPRVRSYRRIALEGWLIGIAAADVIGALFLGSGLLLLYIGVTPYSVAKLTDGLAMFGVAWLASAGAYSLYCRRMLTAGLRRNLRTAAKCTVLAFGMLLLLGFASKSLTEISRFWIFSWGVLVLAWVCAIRALWFFRIRTLLRDGACLERALVLASSARAAAGIARSVIEGSHGYIGIVATGGIPGTPGGASIEWLEALVRQAAIDRVIITGFGEAIDCTNRVLARLARLAVDVSLIPDLEGLEAPILNVDRIGILPSVDLAARPLTTSQRALKRAEDLSVSAVMLAAVVPLFAVVSVAIKLESRGPVLFGQLREGYHNHVFRVWKFRTMYHELRDEAASRQTSRQDPRITRTGRILRRLSIDELPQLLNVLRGEMSIVGPRPHALGMTTLGTPVPEVLEEYSARHRLKPGLTGWAQVNGSRGPVETVAKLRERVSLDCYYIDNWSLVLDAWIILKTFGLLFTDGNAY